jgi:hypothetical protein
MLCASISCEYDANVVDMISLYLITKLAKGLAKRVVAIKRSSPPGSHIMEGCTCGSVGANDIFVIWVICPVDVVVLFVEGH